MSRRKRAAATERDPATIYPLDIPGRAWFGLYAGDSDTADGGQAPCFAGPESSMMILGPPRSGKTTSVVIPSVLDAPGAVVSTSTKADVMAQTFVRRWRLGNCYAFDPSGTVHLVKYVTPLRWSPVTGCDVFERAVTTAHSLASAGRPNAQLTESAHWVERAEALLAPLLFAAAQTGSDMATVCRWVLSRDLREPQSVLDRAGHDMARAILAGVAATDERERSGIFSTAAGLLSAYRSEAALASARQPNFDPERFVRSTDTVYICSPAHLQDQMAPLVVALLDQIRTAAFARPANAAPVVFALDEVAGIAPLPGLPSLAAEGGGQGVVTLACLQDLSQARTRWGDAAEGFFSLFNHKLVFPGIGDYRTLQLISSLAGDVQVPVRSVNRVPNPILATIAGSKQMPTVTTSMMWRPRLPVDAIAQGHPGYALRIAGSYPTWAKIGPWWSHGIWHGYGFGTSLAYTERARERPAPTVRRPEGPV